MNAQTQKLAIKLGDAALAEKLVKAGFRNPARIREASDEELEDVLGIGPATRGKLRKQFPKRKGHKAE